MATAAALRDEPAAQAAAPGDFPDIGVSALNPERPFRRWQEATGQGAGAYCRRAWERDGARFARVLADVPCRGDAG